MTEVLQVSITHSLQHFSTSRVLPVLEEHFVDACFISMLDSYHKILRRAVGHQELLLPAVAVALLSPEKQVLLVRKSEENIWGFPGGYMELGETIADTAVREVREETNLDITVTRLIGVCSGPTIRKQYKNGDIVSPLIIFVEGKTESHAHPSPDLHEVQEARFFPKSSPPSLVDCCKIKWDILQGTRESLA